jgi:hypothetical protein
MFFVISFRTFIFTEITNTPEKPEGSWYLQTLQYCIFTESVIFLWKKGIESFRPLPSKNNDLQFLNNRSSAPPKLPTEHLLM